MANKMTDGNKSSVDNSSTQHNKQNIPLPPPPPPPGEDSDSDTDMGHGSTHIPLYEGDEDPGRHWFVCESTWEANQVTAKDRRMAQFTGALRKRALMWYMTFTERTPQASKVEIKVHFLSFFKTLYAKHMAPKKLKRASQKLAKSV